MGLFNNVRKTFTGITDKYLNWGAVPNEFLDVTGTFFHDHLRDIHTRRLERYRRHWGFYRGEHFTQMTAEGTRKFIANYCRLVVDKSVTWLVANGFNIHAPAGNEAILPALNLIWDMNDRNALMVEHAQTGSVTGDAFLYPTLIDVGPDGQPLPVDEQRIVIVNLDPAYVYPVYNMITREIIECLIQFPSFTNAALTQVVANTSLGKQGTYSIHITPKVVTHYWNKEKVRETPNIFGEVNVVHTRNMQLANSIFGLADLDGIIELNEKYNEVGHEIGEIVKYHAAPTTLIYGARASQLEKGANKIISGLPATAKVENLALEGELTAAMSHHKDLKRTIAELSQTPESVWGSMDAVPSNTSGVALEVQWLPLIEKTKMKYVTYGGSIRRVNALLLKLLGTRFKINFGGMVKQKEAILTTLVEFVSPIPQDEKTKIDLESAKVNAGFQSKAGAIRDLGSRDPDRTMVEVQADRLEQMAEDIERERAIANNSVPNVSVFGLGSIALNSATLRAMLAEASAAADKRQKTETANLAKLTAATEEESGEESKNDD